jgi:hypothetical protein
MEKLSDVIKHISNQIDALQPTKVLTHEEFKNTKPLINEVYTQTTYHTGTWFNDCEICDEEITDINPGKQISYEEDLKKHVRHVCNNCFIDPEYLRIYTKVQNLKIKPFEL